MTNVQQSSVTERHSLLAFTEEKTCQNKQYTDIHESICLFHCVITDCHNAGHFGKAR